MAESEHYNGRYILLPCPLEVLGAGEEKETERVDCSWDEYITNKSSALFTSHTHTGLKTKFHTKMVTIWFFLEKKERGDGCADWVSVEEAQGDAIRWPPYTIQNYPVKFSLLLFLPELFDITLVLLDLIARKDNCKKMQFYRRCKESTCERANITEPQPPNKKIVSDWFAIQGNRSYALLV